MINQITKGIAKALSEKFNDIPIYSESVSQGFQEPCFFISLLNSLQKPLLGSRFLQSYFFAVQYFPTDGLNPNREAGEIIPVLYDVLEFIEVDSGLIRGKGMRHEQMDGVVHFFITYDGEGERPKEPLPYMEYLQVEGRSRQHGRKRRKEKDGKA